MNSELISCKHCGAQLNGNYCSDCGQKKITNEDKSVGHFFKEFAASVFFAEGKLARTMRVMVGRPGELSRVYILGDRKRYVTPLQLFFFANLIYFVFPIFSTFNTSLSTQLKHLPYSKYVKPIVFEEIEEQGVSYEEYRSKFEKKSESNAKLLLITMVFIQALGFKLLFLRNKKLFFTDFLAASAYFNATYILVLLIALPAVLLGINYMIPIDFGNLSDSFLSFIFLVLIILYLIFFLKRAFQLTYVSSVWRGILIALILIPSFVVYRFILFWFSFYMT